MAVCKCTGVFVMCPQSRRRLHQTKRLQAHRETYLTIDVRNPRTHIDHEIALFTDYEIIVQTNNIAFAISHSRVRRRYSDFLWLRNRLQYLCRLERNLPELPPRCIFGRFKNQVLNYRKKELKRFLEDITKEPVYLSDIGLHLFLQTKLPVPVIEEKLNGYDSGGELIDVLQSPSLNCEWLSRSISDFEFTEAVSMDTDSGCSVNLTYQSNYSLASGISKEKSRFLKYHDRMRQQNSCHHCTIQNSHSDSAYSSMYSNSCSRNEDAYLTSDDNLCNELYDADDEIDGVVLERTGVTEETCEQPASKLRTETDHLFCFSQSDLGDQNIGYSLDRAMEIIKERPKLTERLSMEDDSDDCFRESEYDVIDTDEDLNMMENNGTFSAMTMPVITLRSYDSPDEGIVEIIAACKKKQRVGKVKSLPNIRFPLRKKLNALKRTSLYLDNTYDYKFRHSLRKYNSSDSEDISSSELHTFPRRHKISKNGSLVDENEAKIRCYDIFKQRELSNTLHVSNKSADLTVTTDTRLGRFHICHIVEHPLTYK